MCKCFYYSIAKLFLFQKQRQRNLEGRRRHTERERHLSSASLHMQLPSSGAVVLCNVWCSTGYTTTCLPWASIYSEGDSTALEIPLVSWHLPHMIMARHIPYLVNYNSSHVPSLLQHCFKNIFIGLFFLHRNDLVHILLREY